MATSTIELNKNVSDFIAKPRKMLINGAWVESASGKLFDTYNPATGEVLARVAEGDRADIDRAVTAARRAFESGPWPRLKATSSSPRAGTWSTPTNICGPPCKPFADARSTARSVRCGAPTAR